MTATCTLNTNWIEAQEKSRNFSHSRKQRNIAEYNSNPKLCKNCELPIDYARRVNNFCSKSCAASVNNSLFPKRVAIISSGRIERKRVSSSRIIVERTVECRWCKKEFSTFSRTKKYCYGGCRSKEKLATNVSEFFSGMPVGHDRARKALIVTNGARCSLCGWAAINPTSGKCPIELDHIDGDSSNTIVSNVRLLCPNCHSLQPTYKALNKGNGRVSRMNRYNAGKSY